MEMLEKKSQKFITRKAENVYEVSGYNKEEVEKQFQRAIIDAKILWVSEHRQFSLDDFALVRITTTENYPCNFKYYPYDETNCYINIENPFYPIIGYLRYDVDDFYRDLNVQCPHNAIKYDIYDLLSPRYRDTKHFSINSLASNIYRFFGLETTFDKECAFLIIEPLKDHLTDPRLAVLNPVDTFFDLHETSMDIGENAVFLIQEDFLDKIDDPQFKEQLKNYKIFIYKDNPALATDIVLSYLGYIPQRSFQQSQLKPAYYFQDKKELSDAEYINQYRNYMEYLNNEYLHTTYLNVPDKFAQNRLHHARDFIGLPGVLHSETKYYREEIDRNVQADINTYTEYIKFIFSLVDVREEKILDFISLVIDDVYDKAGLPIQRTFFDAFKKYESDIRDMIVKLTYPKFAQATGYFNNRQLSKKDKRRQG